MKKSEYSEVRLVVVLKSAHSKTVIFEKERFMKYFHITPTAKFDHLNCEIDAKLENVTTSVDPDGFVTVTAFYKTAVK